MTSLKTSLRNTGWSGHTPKISLSKSDISPERLYHSRSRFSKKLIVSVGVSWSGKTNVFYWSTENKSWPELLHWSLLTAWMSSSLSGQRQCSVTPCKVMEHFLRQNTPDFIAADKWASYSQDLNLLDYCIWDILQDLVYEGRRLRTRLQIYGTSKRQSKTNGRRSSLRQFENPLHNGKATECG